MPQLRTAHTSEIEVATLDAVRALLDRAFDGAFSDDDWDHALGGVHALLWDGDELVGHGSLVQRRLLHAGRALRAGYVEAVAVRPDRRRQGHGGAIMSALERVVLGAYDLGALSTTAVGERLYLARGWQRWEGPTSAVTPSGVQRTPEDDGSVYVMPVTARLDVRAEITCDWRDGDVW